MLGRLLNDSIPLLTLTSWVKAAAKCGFSIEPIFERVGIPADLTQLEKVRVSPLKLLGLLQACVDASRAAARGPGPHPHYPFVLGESFAFEFMPELETYLTTSSTLREAVKATGWAADLINPMMKLTLQEQADEARIVLSFDLPFLPQAVLNHPALVYVAEATQVGLYNILRRLLGDSRALRRMTWRHAAPPYAERYDQVFGVPSIFGHKETALVGDRQALDWQLSGAFPALNRQAEQLVAQRVERRHEQGAGGLIEQIEHLLASRPELMAQGIDALAAHLGLHTRTLQRRLKEAERSYADIQADVRRTLALGWLADGELDIESISQRLGYSDRRAFTLAFKRWTGVSPSQWRSGGAAAAGRDPLDDAIEPPEAP